MLFTPLSVTLNQAQKRPSVQAFERFLGDVVKTPSKISSFTDSEASYALEIDVPGVSKEHLLVKIEEQIVRIETKAESKRKYALSFELPLAIDPAASQAKLEDGVLNLVLSKKKPVDNVAVLNVL
jgi:HSP20 family molecular chaperone IbpA